MAISRIAVLGTGAMGRAMAKLLSKTCTVYLASRAETRQDDGPEGVRRAVGYKAAADEADAILLAVPWWGVEEMLAALAGLSGKIVIDATNPFADASYSALAELGMSGAEHIQRALSGCMVVKAFNYLSAAVPASDDVRFGSAVPTILLAGDHAAAKDEVAALIRAVGMDPRDAGALAEARVLEGLTLILVRQAMSGLGPNFALSLLAR